MPGSANHSLRDAVLPAVLLAGSAAGAMAVTLTHPSATRQFTWPWVVVWALLWIAPIGAILVRRGPWFYPGRLLTAGLLLLALAALGSAALSPFAPLSVLRVWPTLGGVALCFCLHHWLAGGAPPERARHLALGVSFFGALLAGVSLVGWRWQSAEVPWLVRNAVPFGHSNYTAGALLLVLPWLAQVAWQARGLRRLAWSVAAGTGLGALLTTGSRAGVLALGGVGILAAAYAVARASWSRAGKFVAVLAVALALLASLLANQRLRDLVFAGGWGEVARESNAQRRAMAQAGFLLGAQRALLGWGPGTVPLAYPRVRAQLDGGVDNVLQLHSTPVQLWATLGAAGLLALLLLLLAGVRRLGQVVRAPSPRSLAAAAALLTYGLFALTDHQLDLPAPNFLLGLNLALLFFGTGSVTAPAEPLRRFSAGLIGAALLVPLGLTGRDLAARFAYERSLGEFEADRPSAGLAWLEVAARRAPSDPYYRHQWAGRLLAQRSVATDAAERDRLGVAAADQFRLSLAAGCLQEHAHLNLAWLALESGAPRLAEAQFRSTLAEAPFRGGAYFGLGVALLGAREEAAAVRAFALEWINDPAAALAPIWEHPDFARYRPRVAREAGAMLDELTPTYPAAGYVAGLWRWWERDGAPPKHGFNRESAQFVAALAAIGEGRAGSSAVAAYPWGRLLALWRRTPADFSALAPRDPAFAASLARRAARHPPPDVQGFLTAGPEGETDLLLAIRSVRTGHGVLALHPDGPVLTDLYVQQSPRIVSAFASTVFPAKGWLPARELLVRLPAASSLAP